ncbi:hypothetical protein PHYBOEH_005956 [Phytophthora boehmeriae]|uniref:Uncharacterized protein n=1 Tax=Phytophthora boehmeriae TaxID=109152 RepID=A0A8T1X7Q5_9STRA|nr:hypothetical protein PHYBOEH_005956 [Phytophthora boehmeriae]
MGLLTAAVKRMQVASMQGGPPLLPRDELEAELIDGGPWRSPEEPGYDGFMRPDAGFPFRGFLCSWPVL